MWFIPTSGKLFTTTKKPTKFETLRGVGYSVFKYFLHDEVICEENKHTYTKHTHAHHTYYAGQL